MVNERVNYHYQGAFLYDSLQNLKRCRQKNVAVRKTLPSQKRCRQKNVAVRKTLPSEFTENLLKIYFFSTHHT